MSELGSTYGLFKAIITFIWRFKAQQIFITAASTNRGQSLCHKLVDVEKKNKEAPWKH